MDGVTFLTSYIVLVFVIVMAEIVVLGNNKGQYLRESYNAIKFICYKSINESSIDDVDYLADEINRLYRKSHRLKNALQMWLSGWMLLYLE